MTEVIKIAKVFNSVSGDANYLEECDLNNDKTINMSDVLIIAAHFNAVPGNYPSIAPTNTIQKKCGKITHPSHQLTLIHMENLL
ncbi:hypothetical protein [Pseudobacteroides cellulosolvens]|nr:hypothetical protein [Pseudobacteroides cellulosolvens]